MSLYKFAESFIQNNPDISLVTSNQIGYDDIYKKYRSEVFYS